MKKHYLMLLLVFLSLATYGQITSLSKISKGRLYSSDIIKDQNNNIKGYFLLFESDKVAKETYELEYVVLDENLTKVTNGFIKEMKYESWLVDADKIKVSASLYKNKLLLQLADSFNGMELFKRYRLLDVTTNVLSEPFIFNKDSLRINPVFDRKNVNMSNNQSENIYFFEGVGMVVDSRMMDKKAKVTERSLIHYNDKLNKVWSYKYNNIKDKVLKSFTCLKSDAEVIVLFNHDTKNNSLLTWEPGHSVLFLDSKTGKLKNEFVFPLQDKNAYSVVDCKITDDKIYLLGNYSAKTKTGWLDDDNNKGLYKFTFDKQTGKLEDSKFLTWEQFNGKLEINKNGKVKKEGFIYIHNMLQLENNKIIVVAETFDSGPIITNNMYLMELTDKFSLGQIFPIEKFRNKFPKTGAHSSDIKRYGLFDFIDYQDLGDDEYLFFLNDNEKKSKNRNKSTLYGIVSYSDGKFNRQTLNLKTETSTIHANNGKKGYMMIVEDFDEKGKSTEIRLEKINY